ncbi:MAG TPA: hypothetical protein VHY84_27310 [Bryobacteraceae bacterium]|jgi:hypothetical protein|nr:hypothetical protein [Bryobacteraceae bacterium]
MKNLFILLVTCVSAFAQGGSSVAVNANVQILSAAAVKAKYGLALPKGMWAGSVVAENISSGAVVVGQGTILKALRDQNYPALSRADAAAVILHASHAGVFGFIVNNAAFGSKLLNDLEGLVVSGALHVTPGVGVIIAGASTVAAKLSPDLVSQLQQFQQTYDADGLQNLLQLSPGQSAVGTVIFDSPGAGVKSIPASFSVPVFVAAVH